ncbi:hypothetical protein JW766_05305 [Candidatus Dojkabacteria bacterium]|nr:hypothetical protein [Candidatus Dojkabacteria bacterium]
MTEVEARARLTGPQTTLVILTTNDNKAGRYARLFSIPGIPTLNSIQALEVSHKSEIPEIEETGGSALANSQIKAEEGYVMLVARHRYGAPVIVGDTECNINESGYPGQLINRPSAEIQWTGKKGSLAQAEAYLAFFEAQNFGDQVPAEYNVCFSVTIPDYNQPGGFRIVSVESPVIGYFDVEALRTAIVERGDSINFDLGQYFRLDLTQYPDIQWDKEIPPSWYDLDQIPGAWEIIHAREVLIIRKELEIYYQAN